MARSNIVGPYKQVQWCLYKRSNVLIDSKYIKGSLTCLELRNGDLNSGVASGWHGWTMYRGPGAKRPLSRHWRCQTSDTETKPILQPCNCILFQESLYHNAQNEKINQSINKQTNKNTKYKNETLKILLLFFSNSSARSWTPKNTKCINIWGFRILFQ